MCASSCWKRLTLVRPVRAPDNSLRCNTPKSAKRRGSSLQERGRWSNIRLANKEHVYIMKNYPCSTFCIQGYCQCLLQLTTLQTSVAVNTERFCTSVQGSSWAWEQRSPSPPQRRTCFRCSAASVLRFAIVCCCRCSVWPLPGIPSFCIHSTQ